MRKKNQQVGNHDPFNYEVSNHVLSFPGIPNVSSVDSVISFFDWEESENIKKLWVETQGKFVGEPRIAVQKADETDVSKPIFHIVTEDPQTK